LDDLVTNETIFTDTPTEVRALLTASGYANQRAKVQLLWETEKGMEVVDAINPWDVITRIRVWDGVQ